MARKRHKGVPIKRKIPDLGSGPTIELWTRMNRKFYEQLLRNGVIRGSEDHVWAEFVEPYKWMIEQMKQRIPGFAGGYPIWAWTRRKDAEWSGRPRKAHDRVLVRWRAPRDQVLLSDFFTWHAVLGGRLLARNEAEYDAWHEELEQRGLDRFGRHLDDYPPDIRERLEASWQLVFDGWDQIDGQWHGKHVRVQAVIPELRMNQVIAIYDVRKLAKGKGKRRHRRKRARLYRARSLDEVQRLLNPERLNPAKG
jgi:hypothetical protein